MKRSLALVIAALMLCCLLAACTDKKDGGISSAIANTEITSSISSKNESAQSKVTTTSAPESAKSDSSKTYSHRYPYGQDRSSKPQITRPTQSESESESVKIYKNSGTVQIIAYGFRLNTCTANGIDDESKLAEYKDVVNQGYFNAFFVPTDADVLTQAEIIAQAGGSMWLHVGDFRSYRESIESYIDDAKFYVDMLTNKGYGELINGFYWDEPVWRGMTNEDFLTMTRELYKTFGLRNFPVFATGEFSGLEGNEIGTEADDMNKVLTPSLKYVSDIAFDAYGVDVRDGAVPTADTLKRWKENISPNVTDTKSYYTEYKNKLKKHAGHPVTFWYYPCAYEAPVGTGLNNIKRANEDYCIGHLEFMANDVLKEEYAGGVVLYTYYTSGDRYGLQRHLAIKDTNGNYKYYPNEEKWDKYFLTLKNVCTKFNSVKTKKLKLNV